MEGAGVV